jgi:hypothetical protein
MKKFFLFLVLMMGVFSLMAVSVHPPGVDSPAMSGYELIAVTPDTVLALEPLIADSSGSIIAEPVYGGWSSDTLQVVPFDTWQSGIGEVIQKVHFPLLC